MTDATGGEDTAVTAEEMVNIATNPFIRLMWKGLGFLFVGLGTIGIYIPGIPTTSFMVSAISLIVTSLPVPTLMCDSIGLVLAL